MSSTKKETTTVTKVDSEGNRTVTTTVTTSEGSTSSCFSDKIPAKSASAATPKTKAPAKEPASTATPKAKTPAKEPASTATPKAKAPAKEPVSAAAPKAKAQGTPSSTTGKTPSKPASSATPKAKAPAKDTPAKTPAKPASKPTSTETPKVKAPAKDTPAKPTSKPASTAPPKAPAAPKAPAVPKAPAKAIPLTFEQVVLAEHNRLRARHSSPPLKLNPTLSRYAQEWANHLAARNLFYHRPNAKYAENLYACFGRTTVDGKEPVQSWYNEIKHYTFGQPTPRDWAKVGHFTQLVWKATRELGVGWAKNGNNFYVACCYDPHGNYPGQYATNVLRS